MLQRLFIKNYALIDQLEIDFAEGVNIITGETGAGKSILLGALSLLIGQRADVQVLQNKTLKCIIEGSFLAKNSIEVVQFLERNGLDIEKNIFVRREINPEGKSRAFINDTPVTLSQLKELGFYLIDIHSQHETLRLNEADFQLSVIDAFAQQNELLQAYKKIFFSFRDLKNKLAELIENEKQSKKEYDYFLFQFNELEEISLKNGEQEKIEEELNTLNNAEKIKADISKALYALNEGESNIISAFSELKPVFNGIANYGKSMSELNSRFNSLSIELKDIVNELENSEQKIVYDPKRIEELTNRLDILYRLEQKHQVKTVGELIEIRESLGVKIETISSMEMEIKKQQVALDKIETEVVKMAKKISSNRLAVFSKMEKEIKTLLLDVAMPNAQFKITHILLENPTEIGLDKIKFLFSANKGSDLKELNKVASGGELSRLMLCIKSL
ncbi:MAG TPA: AAA family ATPase, partial [Bacteroidia bacterium]|nr:AAA family ATPase [Bacteroidia bacterium]